MKSANEKTYALWCEHPFAIYSALPIVEKYRGKRRKVVIYTNSECKSYAISYLGFVEKDIVIINDYQSKNGIMITRLFELIFIPLSFSPAFVLRKKIKWSDKNLKISELFGLFKIHGKFTNKIYKKWIRLFLFTRTIKSIAVIKPDLLISFTKAYVPYLLSQFGSAKNIMLFLF